MVATLFVLCLKKVEVLLVRVSERFIGNKRKSLNEYSKIIEGFKRQLCEVPSPCHDALAVHCLEAAERFVDNLSSKSTELVSRNEFVIQQLVSITTHLKMRKLSFLKWSVPVVEVLLNFLWRMTYLEELSCFVDPDVPMKLEPRLRESLPFLNNLTTFDSNNCTDETIAVLCKNCKHLTGVDMSLYSPQVTDDSIDSLILCKKLETVNLWDTEITDAGLVKLLTKSQSKNLKEVLPRILSCGFLALLETEAALSDTLPIQNFEGLNIDQGHLPLICKYFSHVESVELSYEQEEWPDFSCLDCLENVESFTVSIYDPPKRIEQHSLKSQNLSILNLCNVLQISISELFNIGEHCPNLNSLYLSCPLSKDMDDLTASLQRKPFQKLTDFSSRTCACGVDLLLMHAVNIKNISLKAGCCLTDTVLTKVFMFNKLKELECLEISSENNISVKMLKSIILRCKKIKFLGNFAPSDDDDALVKDEFERLQKFITENKYKVMLQ